MEPFDLDPMALIETQARKIVQLTNENVQLTAAVAQYQQQMTSMMESAVEDVTEDIMGAEITA